MLQSLKMSQEKEIELGKSNKYICYRRNGSISRNGLK